MCIHVSASLPWRWEKDRRVAGTERLDGVPVVRVTTGARIVRILRDSNTRLGLLTSLGLTRASGLPREIGPVARRVIVHNVASFEAGSWVGNPHAIAAPATLGPIADFEIGIDALGDAQDAKH